MQFEFDNQEAKDVLMPLVDKSVVLWGEEKHEGHDELRDAAELLRSAEPGVKVDVPERLHKAMGAIIEAWDELQKQEMLAAVLGQLVAHLERGNQPVH